MSSVKREIQAARSRWAARRASDSSERDALAHYLSAHPGAEPAWFEVKDDDELNGALSAGRYTTVLFADLDALWEMIWKHHADLDRWDAAGVTIELARSPITPDWRALVREAHASLQRHRVNQSRRQTIAATILSLVAVATLAVLLILR